MAEFLDYLNSLIRQRHHFPIFNDEVFTNACLDPSESEGWAGLKEELSQVLGDSRMENTAFFTRFTLKLNEVLASLHQKNEKNIPFKNDYDNKYVEVLRSDREKPDIGFDDPHVIKVNSTSVSVCEIMGKRPCQEDQYHVGKLEINKESAPSVLKGILNQCEVEAEKIRGSGSGSGSTATLTHLSPQGILTVASVGDSPAMFMAKDKTTSEVVMIPLTHDHEPSDFFESKRIIQNEGWISWGRVTGNLNLSRAIGDFDFKNIEMGASNPVNHISSEPDIVQHDVSAFLNNTYDVCVLTACDGILDHGCANRQNYADLFAVTNTGDDRNFAQRCVSYALNAESKDNITVLSMDINNAPEEGVLMAVFDGHGGKETSRVCKEVVEKL